MARRPYPLRRPSTSAARLKALEERKKPPSLGGLWVATILFVLLVVVLASTPGMMTGFTVGFLILPALALVGFWISRKDGMPDETPAQQVADEVLGRLREQKLSEQAHEQEVWEKEFLRLNYPGMTDQEAKRAAEIDAIRERALKWMEEDRKRFEGHGSPGA